MVALHHHLLGLHLVHAVEVHHLVQVHHAQVLRDQPQAPTAIARHPVAALQVAAIHLIAIHADQDQVLRDQAHVHHQIAQIVLPVHTGTEIHVHHPIAVRRVIVHRVARRVDRQIDAILEHHLGVQMNAGPSATEIHVRVPVRHLIVGSAVTAQEIHAQVLIAQRVARTETESHVRVPVHLQIAETIDVQVPIAPIVRPVHTAIEIHVRVLVRHLIVENAVTVHAIRVQVLIVQIVRLVRMGIAQTVVDQAKVVRQIVATRVHLQIAHRVRIQTATRVQLPIVLVVITHLLAIVHALAMIVTRVHLRVIANAVVVRIVPVVDTPMIATSVHAVA